MIRERNIGLPDELILRNGQFMNRSVNIFAMFVLLLTLTVFKDGLHCLKVQAVV